MILLPPGDASSDLWGDQVPALLAARHRVILIDSRGQGRSTWDGRPLHYETMADDVLAVMNALHLRRAAFVGWSDGAIISLILAMDAPERVTRVYAFGANMDLNGFNLAGALAPTLRLSQALLERNYARVSPTPDNWKAVSAAVFDMQTREPTYSADDLGRDRRPEDRDRGRRPRGVHQPRPHRVPRPHHPWGEAHPAEGRGPLRAPAGPAGVQSLDAAVSQPAGEGPCFSAGAASAPSSRRASRPPAA